MKNSDLIKLLAHYDVVVGIARDVAGMQGFACYWLSKLAPHERRACEGFEAAKKKAFLDLYKGLEKPLSQPVQKP